METDRNLLFGVSALQLELIDLNQFGEACAQWALQKSIPLSQILAERKWITPDDRRDIERLMARKLQKHGDDASKALGASVAPGVLESMRQIEDESVWQTLSLLTPTGYVQLETVDLEAEQRSRFTLTRLHGQGGLGRVWLAHDPKLNRSVALKEIRPDKQNSDQVHRRFVREAQVTGQLEHPNIVPVYEMSTGPNESFYTMRFVHGRRLSDAIRDLHQRRLAGQATARGLRSLLDHFVSICNAIGYAHARGVVHRDLKPGNVMLGDFGEVVVLDWGLAKAVDGADDEPSTAGAKITATAKNGVAPTIEGLAVGTPTFMAPEQAAGKIAEIDARTDIYGLGAILFSILTGKHPHAGDTTEEILHHAVADPTPDPSQENPGTAAPLTAICRKAMAKEQSQRYTQAQDLAEDVKRWLADEPVSVHRDSWSTRLARWTRRHKAWAFSSAAALLIVTATATVAAIWVQHARQGEQRTLARTKEVLRAEQEARAEATRRFRDARTAVDTMLTGVSHVLQYFPGMQAQRIRLLEEAALRYEEYAHERSDDVQLRIESGRSLVRLGDVRRLLDQNDMAQEAYQQADEAFRSLSDAWPDRPQPRFERAITLAKLAICQGEMGEADKAEECYNTAIRIFEELSQAERDDARYRQARAGVMANHAQLLLRTAQDDQAVAVAKQAVTAYETLRSQDSTFPIRAGLASARLQLGNCLRVADRKSEAIQVLEVATREFADLASDASDHPPYLQRSAECHLVLAAAHRSMGRDETEAQAYREAIEDYEQLIAVQGDVPHYRVELAMARADLALLLNARGGNHAARKLAEEAIGEVDALREYQPRVLSYRETSAFAHATLAGILRDLDETAGAIMMLQTAIQQYDELVQEASDYEIAYRGPLAASLNLMGRLAETMDEGPRAGEFYRMAIKGFQKCLAEDPENAAYQDGLAWSHTHLADLLWDTDERDTAVTHYKKAFSLREFLEQPGHVHNLAKFLVWRKDREIGDLERAVESAQQALGQSPDNARFLVTLAAAYCRLEHYPECFEVLRRVERLNPGDNSAHEFWLALAYLGRGLPGDEAEAKKSFEQAVRRMESHAPGHAELLELRAEVERQLNALSAD